VSRSGRLRPAHPARTARDPASAADRRVPLIARRPQPTGASGWSSGRRGRLARPAGAAGWRGKPRLPRHLPAPP